MDITRKFLHKRIFRADAIKNPPERVRMDKLNQDFLKHTGIDESIIRLTEGVEQEIRDIIRDRIRREINQYKVIAAMQEHRLSDSHFGGTTGYGYNDRGRSARQRICFRIRAEDALVRHQIVSAPIHSHMSLREPETGGRVAFRYRQAI